MKKFLFFLILFFLVFLACVLLGEGMVRFSDVREKLELNQSERSLFYDYHETLGWFPKSLSAGIHNASIEYTTKHNQMGFRDREHGLKTKKRIAFIGDSFVWGYDSEEKDRFANLLQKKLPEIDILNLGVSGYGTDQKLLLLQEYYPLLKPDSVFLVYESSDSQYDDLQNFVYEGYYKPYYAIKKGELVLRGVPVPKSLQYLRGKNFLVNQSYLYRFLIDHLGLLIPHYRKIRQDEHFQIVTKKIISQMKIFLESKGVDFAIVFADSDPEIENYCDEIGIPVIDVAFSMEDETLRFPDGGNHWTQEGNRIVSERIFHFLTQKGIV